MNKSLSLGVKLAIFAVLAVAFGATVIALSVRGRNGNRYEQTSQWDETNAIDRSFTVKPGDNFVLDADAGDVRVTGIDGEELKIHVTQRGDNDVMRKYHVSIDQAGNTVTVRGKFEKRFFRFWNDSHWEVRYEVQVPKKFNVDLQTSGGNLVVRSVAGNILGETSGGDLDIEDLEGTIKLSTSGGDVGMVKCTGEMDLETSGGNIVGESLNGSMHVETSGGNIGIRDADGKLFASTSGGNIRAELKDNKGIDLSTSGGNITVLLPKAITADVRAESTGGDVSCEFPFEGKMKDESLHGKINGGGKQIMLESSGGSIAINTVE
jgi:DUF4097 and DUF4098 domain-containing protein YvlB